MEPTKEQIKQVFSAAMKIAVERGERLPTAAHVHLALASDFEVTYVAGFPLAELHYVQVRRAANQLAVLSWDATQDHFQAFPMLPGAWQDVLIAEASKIATRQLN